MKDILKDIFIVEDDENLREIIEYALKSEGYEVTAFESSRDFWPAMEQKLPTLCILDIMLPEEDGLSILKKLKGKDRTRQVPIILLTAKSGEMDKVKGLDDGAEDYITKPFSVLEFLARVRVALRRKADDKESPQLTLGFLVLDDLRHMVTVKGEEISLTYKEYELLHLLLKNQGFVLTRETILSRLWGYEYEGESRTLDVHIRTLRQKLGDAQGYLQTIRGIGYKMEYSEE